MMVQFAVALFAIVVHYTTAHLDVVHREEDVNSVEYGKPAILQCKSNDKDHNFLFWEIDANGTKIGPSSRYDEMKYDYEVLSGKLYIKTTKWEDAGIYNCVSRGVRNNNINVRTVRMIVKNDPKHVEKNSIPLEEKHITETTIVVISSLIIVLGSAYLIYIFWKKHYQRDTISESLDEDEESAEEFFSNRAHSSSTGNIIIDSKVATGCVNIGLGEFKDDFSDDST